MGLLGWIILGGLAGWVASMIMKTNAEQGIFLNIIVGVIGAVIGGFILSLLGGEGVNGFNAYSFFVSLIGAVVLIAIVKSLRKA